ncbi:MAG: DUF3017 domain-containing protein [Aeromicrobium sp.]|uniref:DUF3017 domain-containing protein n=1 Tax=Aeromicrobium sp. TaxID=1871063 RepID=UPI0039E70CFE
MSQGGPSLLRVPRTYGTRVYVVLLALVLLGLALVALGYWRRGIVVVGGSFVIAALVRTALSDEQSGLLAVRGKTFDVAWTSFVGVALIVLGLAVPGVPAP